jgi:hypothetical protein
MSGPERKVAVAAVCAAVGLVIGLSIGSLRTPAEFVCNGSTGVYRSRENVVPVPGDPACMPVKAPGQPVAIS